MCLRIRPFLNIAVLFGALMGCGRHDPIKPTAVKASYVLAKIPYGTNKNDEREIWSSGWDTTSYMELIHLEVFGSLRRYRKLGWAREAERGNRIFQTYELVSGRMGLEPVTLFHYDTNTNGNYQENGWNTRTDLGFRDKGMGVKFGALEVRLEGKWKRLSRRYITDMTSADGPFKLHKTEWDAYFGDIAVYMKGIELLRQRVENITALDLQTKCQVFPQHDLFVYLDGLEYGPGTAWFLDLTLGHTKPPQGSNEIFPGRINTLPTLSPDGSKFVRVDGTDEYAGLKDRDDRKHEYGKPYRISVKFDDPDFEYGDEITHYDWDRGDGKIVTTKKPEFIHTFKTTDKVILRQYRIKIRAYDRSGQAGPWGILPIEELYFQKGVPNVMRYDTADQMNKWIK